MCIDRDSYVLILPMPADHASLGTVLCLVRVRPEGAGRALATQGPAPTHRSRKFSYFCRGQCQSATRAYPGYLATAISVRSRWRRSPPPLFPFFLHTHINRYLNRFHVDIQSSLPHPVSSSLSLSRSVSCQTFPTNSHVNCFYLIMTMDQPTPSDNQQVSHALESEPSEPFMVRKRLAVLGARGVGKSALCIRCALERFESIYLRTLQDVYRWLPVVDGIHYDVSIDDTDGQDETSEFGIRYTTGIDGYVLVFSVRDERSFHIVKAVNDKLLDTLTVLQRKGVKELPRVLVANQVDMVNERKVPREVAENWAKEEGIPYIEASAFTPYNATEPFINILQIIDRNLRESHASFPLYQARSADEDEESDVEPVQNTSNRICSIQ